MVKGGGVSGRGAQPNGEGMTVALIEAIRHPLRREILRKLHVAGEACSSSQLAKILSKDVTSVNYHMKALAKRRAVKKTSSKRVRGVQEHFFASAVAKNDRLVAILADTEREDGGPRR